jgi:hypothetical protein
MTIYEELLGYGWTDEQIRKAADTHNSTRDFTLAVMDTPDGTPIVGISYQCDYRAEEEWGIKDLATAINGNKKQANHVGTFTGLHALAIATQPIEDLTTWSADIFPLGDLTTRWPVQRGEAYSSYFRDNYAYAQGLPSSSNLRWKKMPELRELAKTHGVTPIPRKKDDLIEKLVTSDEYSRSAEYPDRWPGWFHNGDVLILRAESGVVADVLDLLYEAGKKNALAIGGGHAAFSSGIGVYDSRDVGKKLKKQRKLEKKWYDRQMKNLEPVAAELKKRGHDWYFLGKPKDGFKDLVDYSVEGNRRTVNSEDVYYWLNGHGRGPGYTSQPSGWYTLKELLAEKFVDDVNAKETRRGN